MPNWNPNANEVLGLEFFANHDQELRVWGGAPARMMRMPSTATETIQSLWMSVNLNRYLRYDVRTLVDVMVEGSEKPAVFQPVELLPTGDEYVGSWHRPDQSQYTLWQYVDSDATSWPGPAQFENIETAVTGDRYIPTFNTSSFAPGGQYENARIGFVELRAIYGANTGFRKLATVFHIGGQWYNPSGGPWRDVHVFGAPYVFWWGEINPSTQKPWVPADIVKFGASGTSRLHIQAGDASSFHFPKIHALRLTVWCIQTENRVAVGV